MSKPTTTTREDDNLAGAKRNGRGHAETIIALHAAYQALESGAESADVEGDEYTDSEAVLERAREIPLEVSVRRGWESPGQDEPAEAEEYRILLSTGGPALRLVGTLSSGSPGSEPVMEVQDWGTPWTEFDPNLEGWDEAAEWFVGCFYFGE